MNKQEFIERLKQERDVASSLMELFKESDTQFFINEAKSVAYNYASIIAKQFDEPQPPRTNGDHIRAMSDEELASALSPYCKQCVFCHREDCQRAHDYPMLSCCRQGILQYLKSEVKENG